MTQVESELGKGSTFRFVIPVQVPSMASQASLAGPLVSSSSLEATAETLQAAAATSRSESPPHSPPLFPAQRLLPSPLDSREPIRPLNILVAEDNPISQRIMFVSHISFSPSSAL